MIYLDVPLEVGEITHLLTIDPNFLGHPSIEFSYEIILFKKHGRVYLKDQLNLRDGYSTAHHVSLYKFSHRRSRPFSKVDMCFLQRNQTRRLLGESTLNLYHHAATLYTKHTYIYIYIYMGYIGHTQEWGTNCSGTPYFSL